VALATCSASWPRIRSASSGADDRFAGADPHVQVLRTLGLRLRFRLAATPLRGERDVCFHVVTDHGSDACFDE
jgi:hypothetical protein